MTPVGRLEITLFSRGTPTPGESDGYIPSREIKSRSVCNTRRRFASSRAAFCVWGSAVKKDSSFSTDVAKPRWMSVRMRSALSMTRDLAESSSRACVDRCPPRISTRELPRAFRISSYASVSFVSVRPGYQSACLSLKQDAGTRSPPQMSL